MGAEGLVSIQLASGGMTEIPITLQMYLEAADKGLSFSQYFNQRAAGCDLSQGTPFEQAMRNSGLYLSEDPHFGMRVPTIEQILAGKAELNNSAVTRPDGALSRTPAGRILFPAVLLEILESSLRENKEGYNGAFMSMVAFTRSITSPKYEQVIVNHANPQAARGMPIAQLDRPARMLTLTLADITRTIPTYGIGMEVSKQALAAATLDMVGLAVREHALEERSAIIDRDLVAMIQGDADANYSALTSRKAVDFDSSIASVGVITQKAWVKFLRRAWRSRNITNVICDIDVFLAIEGRANRPTKQHDAAIDERLNTVPRIMIPGLPGAIDFFITETSLLGANTLAALDKSKAIRRIVYTGGDYSATEEFVMRKSQVIRMDWAERMERAGYDEAWDVMTLTL